MVDRIAALFNKLNAPTKLFITAAFILLVSLFVVMIALWQPASYSPLYTDLSPGDAARIIDELRADRVNYRLSEDGKTIFVQAERVAEQRVELAGKGLPATGVVGFEVFDKNKMGITEAGQRVDYQRAIEGELTRTIMGFPEVTSARVHLVMPQPDSFLEEPEPASASVVIHTQTGTRLRDSQVKGIVHLVSHAVENLTDDNITVTDGEGNLLYGAESTLGFSDEQLAYKRKVERDLELKAIKVLEKSYGQGTVEAAATVEIDFSKSSKQSETYTPSAGDKGLVKTERMSETTKDSSSGEEGGVPGTTSNIPGYVGVVGGTGSTSEKETSSTIDRTYDNNREVVSTELPGGTIVGRSISIVITDPEFSEQKRSEAELLVASAIGARITEGDKIVVTGKPPAPVTPVQAEVVGRAVGRQKLDDYIRYGLAALIVIISLLVLRGMVNSFSPNIKMAFEAMDIAEEVPRLDLAITSAEEERADVDVYGVRRIKEIPRTKQQQMKDEIILQVRDDPTEVVKIIRNWLLED
ncbi:MAG: flagellar M-ring protein FliF [bacterium]